jgi:8-oxo-dGTP pyrophosphatase MutT (NUDIX family)
MPKTEPVIAHPAATVVLLRDADVGCEVLLVQRSAKLAFHGGAWVFPGGRIDEEDYAAGGGDVVAAARVAAVREAREEAGVIISPERLILFSRWVTPELVPKRFDTWFFAAACGDECVRVDGGEIHAYQWLSPAAALAAQQAGDIDLPPPTFVTLTQLIDTGGAESTLAALRRGRVETFLPRLGTAAGVPCTLYDGDVAYEDGDTEKPGPRHRLLMLPSGWRYERTI